MSNQTSPTYYYIDSSGEGKSPIAQLAADIAALKQAGQVSVDMETVAPPPPPAISLKSITESMGLSPYKSSLYAQLTKGGLMPKKVGAPILQPIDGPVSGPIQQEITGVAAPMGEWQGYKLGKAEPFPQDKWKGMGPKPQWDVLTAMRGPDFALNPSLKWATTAVLRARMRKILRPEGGSAMTNGVLGFIVVPYGTTLTRGLMHPFDVSHFIQHAVEAAQLTGVSVMTIPEDRWIAGLIKGGHPTYFLNHLHETATDKDEGAFWKTALTMGKVGLGDE